MPCQAFDLGTGARVLNIDKAKDLSQRHFKASHRPGAALAFHPRLPVLVWVDHLVNEQQEPAHAVATNLQMQRLPG